MNDKALEHAYKLFVDDGYTHGPEDFKKLIESNPAALNRSYELFKGDGYIHGIDNFKSLVGVEAAKQEKPGMLSNIASGISDFFSSDNEDLKKKDEQDISGSSLAESSSALSSKPKTPFEIAAAKARGEYIAPTGDLQEQIKAASKSGLNESYMGAEVPYEQTYAAKHKEEVTQETASNKKFSNDFTSQEDFKKSMGEVNKDLIDRDEGDATTRLKYLFGDYGFKFDKAGAGYDAIKVTAPNGKVLDLSIDRFTDKGDIESSNELKSFIDSNKPKINKVVSEYDKYYKKYTNQKEVDESLSSIRKDQSALREEQKNLSIDIIKTKAQEEELKKNPNPEMLSQLYEKKQEIAKRAAALEQKQSLNKTNDDRLNEAVGKYVKSTSDQGTWYGAIGSKLLDGVMQSEYTLMDYFQYGFKKLGSDKMLYGKDADKMTEKEKDEAFKKAADMTFGEGKKITKEITSLGVSKGYVEDASKNAIYRNALGIAEFIPAIGAMTANPVAGYTAFFASGYDGATEEMQNSAAFDDVPKGEQVVMATALGIANAAIMKIAPTSKFMESAAGKSMVANIIKRMGSEASAKTMQEFADNEVQSALNRGLIVAGANAAHGFATGVELKLSGDAVKEIYNTAKGEDKFQFPDNAKDYIQQVFESGVDMAIGGAMMGGFNILGTAYRDKNFNGVSDAVIDHYKSLTNPDILSAYEQKLDIAVSNGDITESKKQETLNDAKMSIGILEKMPDDLSAPQKRKSFSLIKERDELQQSIEGKDANLVKPQKTRIQEINSELEEIAAAKNAATAEVPATAAEAQVAAKPKTFDEYSDELKLELQYFLDNEEGYLKQEEQYIAQHQEARKAKGILGRITSSKPSTEYLDKARSRVEMLKNNPEQYINDEINKYEKYKEEEGEDFENQNHLDYLKETQSKLQEENAVQKPTTEEGVLRTEQPEVGLPKMGEGNAQETTTQEGVTPAKPEEVKPIDQELAELEQMFPTEGPTGENKGVAASDTKAMEEMHSRSTDERVQKVVKTAQRLTKTLKSLIPTADIHLHETDESYNGAMEQLNGNKNSDGHFIMGKNADGKSVVRIDINLSRATPVVVAHEVAHVVLQKAFGNNQKLFQSFQEKIAKVLSTDSNQKLLDFANQDAYKEGGVTYEEYMVQLKALLSEQGTKLELSTAKKIAAVINEYVSRITKGAFKPFQEITDVKQVVDFVNKVTEAMAKGEAIDVEAAGKVGEGSRSSIKAFHGSPYEIDKFKTEKIGTGEGVQAFGWGLYFTDLKNIAQSYADKLGGNPKIFYNGKDIRDIPEFTDIYYYLDPNNNGVISFSKVSQVEKMMDTTEEMAKSFLKSNYDKNDIYEQSYADESKNVLNSINKIRKNLNEFTVIKGKNLYDVTLHEGKTPDQYTYLEWDKKPSPQVLKKIMEAFGKAEDSVGIKESDNKRDIDLVKDLNGKEIYQAFSEILKSQKQASLFLLENGIDGIKYPAESIARGATSENARGFNYVVFDENAATINAVSRSSLRTAEQVDKMVKDARASGYSEKAIEEFLKKRGVDQAIIDKSLGKKESGTKIVTNEEMMPGYDKMMEDVNSEILRGLDRKTKETTIEKNVMKIVEGSEAYKKATDQQKEQMTRDVKEAFGEKMKQAPSAEKVLGKKKTMITVDEAQARNAQIKLEMKAALEGAKSVTEKIKAVKDYFDSVKDSGNLTRKDLTKVMAAIAKVKDEKTLDKAVNKINDIIDNATSDKIEISEKKMLQNTIKEVKLAKGNIKEKRKLITDVIEGFKKLGKLTVNQVNALLKKANNLNVENFEHLAKFIDYAEKIFADAEYEKKLSDAFGKKKSLAKLSESKAKNATLKKLAKDFVNIDPSLVKDIDQYNKIAGELKEAITGSSATRGFVDTVDAALVSKYVDQILKEQHEKVTEMMREQMQELFGVDASTFSYEDMIKAMESTKEDMSEQNEKIVRSAAMKLFDMYSTIIDHMLRTGKDPFTGEDVNIKKSKEDLIKSFMDIDLTKLKIKDAIRAVDALKNFVVNGSTGGMLKVVNEYSGAEKSKEALKNGVKAGVLKVYNTEKIARLLFEYLTPYPVLMDALFGGVGKASYMEKMLGTTSLISNKSKAQKISNNYTDEYVNQFYKQKPNDTAFNTSLNNIERGMLAFVSRAEIGSDAQTKESFEDRKGLIEKSIEVLTNGVESQRKKGEEYQEIYDRILKDSKTAEEVRSKADAINAEAVDYWIEKWGDHYEEMSDIQENIHNTILGKEAFFTPDQYSLLGPEEGLDAETKNEPDITGSAFTKNSKAIYKKKTGRLEERTVKNILPKGKYVDLSFDNNNSNLMLDALIDIKTAGDIIHIDSFLKDDSFKKIMPRAEERELLNRRINLMVLNFRNKNHYDYDEMKKFSKSLNRIGAFGASMVLTSTGQPIKQAIPVAINTLANGVIPHFGVIKLFGHEFNKAKRDFMNRTGEGISLRGSESQTDIKGLDNLLKEAEEGNTGKFMQKLEEVNAAYLKNLLQKPDVYIAKAAWLGYYEKALKKQGIEVSDYSNHEVNKEAAQYASKMVDRQQNVSDADLKGKFFSDKHWAVQFISKTIMPFASFRINQWMRMNTDLGVLTKKTTTAEDRKNAALSLVGFGAEVAVFNAVGMALSQTIYNAAMSLMRSDDDSEEEKLQQEKDDEQYTTNLKKGKGNSLVQDIFSPAPPFDPAFELATYHLLNLVQSLKDIPEDERINIFEPAPKKTILKEFGTLGIAAERIANAQDIVEATVTGKIEQTNFGKKTIKNVRAEDKPLLKKLAAIAILNTTGVLPADFYTTQGYILKEITKNASTKTDTELAKEKRNKADTKKERIQKIRDLNNAIRESDDEEVTAGLLKMKREVQRKLHPVKMSDEAKEIIEKKKDREDRKLNILLSGYETKSDLKRYDPDLYEQNFGEQSDYYQAHTSEMKAESFYNKIKRKNLDEENNYSRPAKNKRKKSNSDGSKRAYYRYSGG